MDVKIISEIERKMGLWYEVNRFYVPGLKLSGLFNSHDFSVTV
jgi:hypothetical protein